MDKISLFTPSVAISEFIETSKALNRLTSYQIVDQADGDSFRAAGQVVLDIARGNKTVSKIGDEFGNHRVLGLQVTYDLAQIIALAMEPDEIAGERNQRLAQTARSTVEAIRNNIQEGESWSEIYNKFRQQINDSGELK